MRFWREYKDPGLKCERVGHREDVQWRRGVRKLNNTFGTPYRGFTAKRRACYRCKAGFTAWVDSDTHPIHSITRSANDFDVLNSEGSIIDSSGWDKDRPKVETEETNVQSN